MIEHNPNQKILSKRKTYAPIAFGPNIFSPRNSKCPNTQEYFWQSTWHFSSLYTFCGKQQSQHLSWQTTSPSHAFFKQRQFCQHSRMHAIMCYHLISKKHTTLAHSTWRLSFFSILEPQVKEKISLKFQEDFPTTSTEVTISSSDVADEEQIFFTQEDKDDDSAEQILQRK